MAINATEAERNRFFSDLALAGADPDAFPFPASPAERQQAAALTNPMNMTVYSGQDGQQQGNQPMLTMNKRQGAPLSLPPMPNNRIGMGEALIRIGGSGLSGALQGDGISQMAKTYGGIQDANRATALAEYNAAVTGAQKAQTREDELAKADALARYREALLKIEQQKADQAGKSKTSKADKEKDEAIAKYDQAITKMQMGLNYLNSGMQLSGMYDGTVGFILNRTQGKPEATAQLLLQELKVDSALLMVAQTKGAISNAEMQLFLSPTPNIKIDDENTWKEWIKKRMELAMTIRNRIASGQRVSDPASASQVQQFGNMGGAAAAPQQQNFQFSPEDEDIIARNQPKS